MIINYKEKRVKVKFHRYSNNDNVMISLHDKKTKSEIITCTLNIESLPDYLVGIKSNHEYKGLTDILIMEGVIRDEVYNFQMGFATVPVYELTAKSIEELLKADKRRLVY